MADLKNLAYRHRFRLHRAVILVFCACELAPSVRR